MLVTSILKIEMDRERRTFNTGPEKAPVIPNSKFSVDDKATPTTRSPKELPHERTVRPKIDWETLGIMDGIAVNREITSLETAQLQKVAIPNDSVASIDEMAMNLMVSTYIF